MDINVSFWNNIDRIQRVLKVGDETIATIMDLDVDSLTSYKFSAKVPSLTSVDSICSRLGLELDTLFVQKCDLSMINSKFLGQCDKLPSRYDFAKLSKSRTIINCLDLLEERFGEGVKISLLRSMQVDPFYFEDPDRELNLNFMVDLCKRLKALGLTDDDYKSLGARSYQTNKNTPMGRLFASYPSVHELVDDICLNLNSLFERNFGYYVSKAESNALYIQSRPTGLAQELLGEKIIGNNTVCLTKQGVFSTFPKYLGYNFTDTIKTKCIYQGDQVTEYKLMFH